MRSLLLALILTGCKDKDSDPGDETTEEQDEDLDGDGYTLEEGDCWGEEPGVEGPPISGDAVYPGAPDEPYDGIDADCAGDDDYDLDGDGYVPAGVEVGDHLGDGDCWDDPDAVPEGFSALNGFPQPTAADVGPGAPDEPYDGIDADCAGDDDFDADADGHATAAHPDAAGETGDDCDDADEAVSPSAAEVCDGADNDCDALVDDADDSLDPAEGGAWYADADGDTFGDPASEALTCVQPAGYVADDTDCDDAAAEVNPGAAEVCDEVDQDCDGTADEDVQTTFYADFDADGFGDAGSTVASCEAPAGYVSDDTDCDDTEAGVNPSAAETCDGADNDCDGDVDDGVQTTFYADSDADGFGDAGSTADACAQPAGYVSDDTDCDDADAGANPGAAEVCDEADNDCDGDADEDSAADAATWYADADGDTYGDASDSALACDQPSGYVSDDTDCDDAAAGTHPDAAEVCDEVDQDCDGTADEGVETTFYADSDADGFGDAGSTADACDQPAGYVSDDTDCDDAEAAISPAATEVCDGLDNDCDATADEDSAADAATWYADADGDTYGDAGATDIACEQPAGYVSDDTDCDDAEAGVNPDASEVCDEVDQDCDGTADEGVETTFYADSDADGFGDAGSTADACDQPAGYVSDDTDCDDTSEIAYPGAAELAGDGADQDCDGGEICYLDDDSDGHRPDASSTAASADADCADAGEALASAPTADCDDSEPAIHPGDEVCNDGLEDNDCDPSTICLLESAGLAAADQEWEGEDAGDYAGSAVDATGDLDGDGASEVLIGASGELAFYVVDSPSSGGAPVDLATVTKLTGASGSNVGTALASGADADGDGLDDVLVGAYGLSSTAGGAYFLSGPLAASGAVSSLADSLISSTSASSNLGFSLALVDDLSGDDLADLVIGANRDDLSGSTNSGAVYLVYGPPAASLSLPADADAALYGTASAEIAGTAVAGVWDADGDGIDELAVGAYGNGAAGANAGAVYVINGPVSGTSSLADADAVLTGAAANAFAGFTLGGQGDADGDGYGDLLIGSHGISTVYLVYGPFTDGSLSGADATLVGTSSTYFGYSVSLAGDFDDDGLSDALVGANRDNTGASLAGAAFVYHSPLSGTISTADAVFTGEAASNQAGYAVSAGDADGDGFDDALIGAWKAGGGTTTGAAYLILGVGE